MSGGTGSTGAPPPGPTTVYRAAHVLPVTASPIRDGFVAVRDGVIVGLGPVKDRPREGALEEVDLGTVALMPGFVNAHTHLELSHLEGAVPGQGGFVPWVKDQLRVRAERDAGEVLPAIRRGIAALQDGGTVAVADVSNSLASVSPLSESRLNALVLHEIIGFDPHRADTIVEETAAVRSSARAGASCRIEVAAHAPHSVSPELFRRLMKNEGIRSIHVAESPAEDEFLRHGGGEWREFLDARVGPVPFAAPGVSPVRYLDGLGVLTPGVLAVHCVRVDLDDAAILAARGAVAVLCPRSNEYLGNGVPPLALLLGSGVPVALGTDSLASCSSLDVLEDARFLSRRFPRLPGSALLHALTRGGALALDFPDLGEIRPGARAEFAVVPCEAATADPVAFLLMDSASARSVS